MKKRIALFLVLILVFSLFPLNIYAAENKNKEITIAPSHDKTGLTDFENLRDALRDYDTINLIAGKTYIIGGKKNGIVKGALDVDSNTTINAKGATIKQVNPGKGIFKTTQSATGGGYSAMVNVTINGGTYIGSTKKSNTFSLVKFFHGNNIQIRNADFKNVYTGHLLELAGCKNVLVENCYFGGKYSEKYNTKNEAVELDNCSEGCLTLPSKKSYDNTACQNITFKNNTVVFSRTFGSHFTYGKGKGKFNRNIYVYNNKLTSTADTGLLVFNWYDSIIENNTIKGKTVGVDIVTCFKDTYKDFAGGYSAVSKNNSKPYNISLKNNKISSEKGYALWIRGISKRPISGIYAENNILQTNQGYSSDRRSAIRVEYGTSKNKSGVVINKNTVKNAKTQYFAYVTDSQSVKINSNKFYYKNAKIQPAVKFYICKNCSASKNSVKKA